MSQMSFGDSEYASKRERTRRETFLAEMEQIIPWAILLNLIDRCTRRRATAGRLIR
jgi:IS5 family transposase